MYCYCHNCREHRTKDECKNPHIVLCDYCASKEGVKNSRIQFRMFSCQYTRMKKMGFDTSYIGTDRVGLWQHLRPMLKKGMTIENWGDVWQIDHIIAVCKIKREGKDPKQVFHYTNLQPLFIHENRKKGIK